VGTEAVESPARAGDTGHRRGAAPVRWLGGGSRWLAWLATFVVVAVTVELGWWSRLDNAVNDGAASKRFTFFWNAAKIVFDIATPETALPVTLALGVLVAWRRHRWSIAGVAAIRVGLVVASVLVLKPLLAVPGPTRNSLGDHGGAFPSGHTTSTLVCMALILAWVGRPRGTTGRVAVNAVFVAIVAASVISLNYHYLSDVVGGVVLGVLIATLPLPVLRRRDAKE
jgi:membrane-associated phospholipid phosphatase